jgi:cell division protein FtsB
MLMSLSEVRVLAFILVLLAIVTPLSAQENDDEVRREVAELRAELAELRAEVAALKAARRNDEQPPKDPAIELLRGQVAELAQTKVESTSRFPIKLFGTIHAHMFANSATPNWMDIPNLVNPDPADGHRGTFSATLRQTRLGFTADGPKLGGVSTSAVVAMDFFGGIPGFQTGQVMGLPRLLVAFARLDGEKTAAEIGQDHVMLAPKDPTSLAGFAFPLLFRSGNLYLRAPQVRVERAITSRLRASGGIIAPIAGDLAIEDYRFVPPALGGERSERPAVQGRLAYSSGEPDAPRHADFGVSGHYGWERRPAELADSWAGAVDFAARREWIGVAGELFAGENVDVFGGALGLDARAAGGWAEIQVKPATRFSIHAGGGVDELRGAARALAVRRRNQSVYGNLIVEVTPELETSFEYRWLATTPRGASERRNHHFDWVFAYKF